MKINFNNKNIHIAATPTARVTNDNDDKDSNDDEENKAVYTSRSRVRVGRSSEKAKCHRPTDRRTEWVVEWRARSVFGFSNLQESTRKT